MLPNANYETSALEMAISSLQTVYNLVGMLLKKNTADLSRVSLRATRAYIMKMMDLGSLKRWYYEHCRLHLFLFFHFLFIL